MNNKKKTIVAVVFILCLMSLSGVGFYLLTDKHVSPKEKELHFDVPEVKENEKDKVVSKVDYYSSLLSEEEKDKATRLQKFNLKKKFEIDSAFMLNDSFEHINDLNDAFGKAFGKTAEVGSTTGDNGNMELESYQDGSDKKEDDSFEKGMNKMISKLSKYQFFGTNKYNEDELKQEKGKDIEELITDLKSLDKELKNPKTKIEKKTSVTKTDVIQEESVDSIHLEDKLTALKAKAFKGLNGKEFTSTHSHHFDKYSSNLFKAEFYKTEVIKNEDIVEIILLENLKVNKKTLMKKGTVLYGVAELSPRRLLIRIPRNIYNSRHSNIRLKVYDFDGREGVYIKEQAIYKIPSDVSSEVIEIIKERSRPSVISGGVSGGRDNTKIEKVAAISAADKIFKHLKRMSIKMVGGYKVWIKVSYK